MITDDHGNGEQMRDPATGQVHNARTSLPVPLIYVGEKNVKSVEGSKLSDIAPTMLSLMGMKFPQKMIVNRLLTLKYPSPMGGKALTPFKKA